MNCDGGCELVTNGRHKGKVVPVRVTGTPSDPWEFNYCQQAIEEDISRGLTVEELSVPEVSDGE